MLRPAGLLAGETAQEELEFGSVVGTCEDMCPADEVAARNRMDDFDALELTDGPPLPVKRFARNIVSLLSADLDATCWDRRLSLLCMHCWNHVACKSHVLRAIAFLMPSQI